ncbi:MAG: cytochrome c oxidase subunit II [Firmicutes bacterium]|nr:cytochrome c oxidase subunit II [Bacillota bacterium]
MQLSYMYLSFWIMAAIFLVVAGVLVVAVIRFRERRGQERELPPQVEGNTALEVVWTIVPILLLAILGVVTVAGSFTLARLAPSSRALVVQVTGHQYWWAYTYPSLGITTANDLHIPVGEKVDLELTSKDVMHAFWVPRLGGKTDLVPGRTNYMWIEADRPGVYTGQCAEFCGTGHADMRLVVEAQTPAQFQAWVQSMKHPSSVPASGLARQGYLDFKTAGCFACHAIAGTPYQGVVGPNLTNLAQRPMIAGNILRNTPANLAAWLRNPPGVKPGALMPNLHLSPSQVRALVAYLESLH